MGTAVASVRTSTALAVIDPNNLNWDVAQKWADQEAAGRRAFRGEQLRFNGQDGRWVLGFGKEPVVLDDGEEVVAIYHQTVIAWQNWAGDFPEYPIIEKVFAGGVLPPRSSLGDHDKSLWKDDQFKKGVKKDPWTRCTVLFCRNRDGTKLYYIMAANVSGSRGIAQLIAECIDEGRRKGGKMPVISLGCGKRVKKEATKDREGQNFYPPLIEVVEWVKALDVDKDGDLMGAVEDEPADDGDQGEVTSRARGGNEDRPSTSRRSRGKQEAEESQDDPDQPENDPRQGNAGKDRARSYEDVERSEPRPRANKRPPESNDNDDPPRRRKGGRL